MTAGVVTGIEASGNVMIDRVGGDKADRYHARQRHRGHEIKHCDRAEQVGKSARQQGCASVARMIEGLVAPGASGKCLGPVMPNEMAAIAGANTEAATLLSAWVRATRVNEEVNGRIRQLRVTSNAATPIIARL